VTDAISLGGLVVVGSAGLALYLRRAANFTIHHAPAE